MTTPNSSFEQAAATLLAIGGPGNHADDPAAPSASEEGGEDDSDSETQLVSLKGLDLAKRSAARASAALRAVLSERLVQAREMAGFTQRDLALELGFQNSTQVCLWEKAQRMPPMRELIELSEVLGVSVDYLIGISEEPDRDAQLARRAVLVASMRRLLDAKVDVMADAILASEFDPAPSIRAHALCSKAQRLSQAVERFRETNAWCFDELPGGAMLLRLSAEVADAAQAVGMVLDQANAYKRGKRKRAQMALAS